MTRGLFRPQDHNGLRGSQYLHRVPVSVSHRGLCYYCNRRTNPSPGNGVNRPDTKTRDHIHLASNGGYSGRSHIDGKIENYRWACAGCNNLRAAIGHCCAVLMLILWEIEAGATKAEALARVTRFERSATPRRRNTKYHVRRGVVMTALRFGV